MPRSTISKRPSSHQQLLLHVVAARQMQAQIADCLDAHRLNMSQWIMLGQLYESVDGLRVSRIASRMQVEAPLVSMMVRSLKAAGLLQLTIDRQDKRARVVQLTAKGRDLVEQVEPCVRKTCQPLMYDNPDETLAAYVNARGWLPHTVAHRCVKI